MKEFKRRGLICDHSPSRLRGPIRQILTTTFPVPGASPNYAGLAVSGGQYRALGFPRNVHPLALWENEVLAVKYRVKAIRLAEYIGRYVNMVGWPVTQKEVWTKDGLTMSFLSLEDETALYETVIFPDVYEKYNRLLFDQRPLLVWGRVWEDLGAVSFEVQRIEVLGAKSAAKTAALAGKAYAFRYPCEIQ